MSEGKSVRYTSSRSYAQPKPEHAGLLVQILRNFFISANAVFIVNVVAVLVLTLLIDAVVLLAFAITFSREPQQPESES